MITFTAQDNDRGRAVAVAHPLAGIGDIRQAGVAIAPQKRGHLGLDRGLQQQLRAQPRYFFNRAG